VAVSLSALAWLCALYSARASVRSNGCCGALLRCLSMDVRLLRGVPMAFDAQTAATTCVACKMVHEQWRTGGRNLAFTACSRLHRRILVISIDTAYRVLLR